VSSVKSQLHDVKVMGALWLTDLGFRELEGAVDEFEEPTDGYEPEDFKVGKLCVQTGHDAAGDAIMELEPAENDMEEGSSHASAMEVSDETRNSIWPIP
jgi:hypothetical protein